MRVGGIDFLHKTGCGSPVSKKRYILTRLDSRESTFIVYYCTSCSRDPSRVLVRVVIIKEGLMTGPFEGAREGNSLKGEFYDGTLEEKAKMSKRLNGYRLCVLP